MPAPVAPLLGFVLGIVLSYAAFARPGKGQPDELGSRPLLIVALFSLLVFTPATGFYLAFAPDWSIAYLVDSQRLPAFFEPALVLADVSSVPLGFVLASGRARERQSGPLVRWAALPTLAALAFILFRLPQLAVQATYAQYHGDFGTRPIAGSLLGYSLIWMNGVLLAGALWTARALRGLDRPAPRR